MSSTANMVFELLDYKLVFKDEGNNTFDIGYCNQVIDLGVQGRYLNVDEDLSSRASFTSWLNHFIICVIAKHLWI